MSAFLFVWNPENWNWHDLDKKIVVHKNTGTASEIWSCVSYRKIKEGDRAFMLVLGKKTNPKGIFASGFVTSSPFLSPHWGDKDKEIYRVSIEFDVLLHPFKDDILEIDMLTEGVLSQQTWLPQASGISIRPEIVDELEALWFSTLEQNSEHFTSSKFDKKFLEGNKRTIIRTSYERNPHARKKCLEHYGFSCRVCGMEFENQYGEIGKDFIHVHHQTMIAEANGEREVDPIKDLIPVCPNCHAMLHKRNPPFTIEELQIKLNL